MKYFIGILLYALVGCGQGPAGQPGAPGEVILASIPTLEGYYQFPNGGYADLYQDAEGLISIRTARLVYFNTDGSTGVLPIVSLANLPVVNGKLYSNSNQTYAVSHNIKQDYSSTVLTGSLLTSVVVSKSGDTLTVVVTVSNSNTVLFSNIINSF